MLKMQSTNQNTSDKNIQLLISSKAAAGSSLEIPPAACEEAESLTTRGGNRAGSVPLVERSEIVQDSGAEASNTAPANCIKYPSDLSFQVWNMGIDSLYLSFKGQVLPERFNELDFLKKLAQSQYTEEQAQAYLSIAGHHFEVRDRGQGKFRYVLIDNWFRIQIASTTAKSLPCLYVQISSEVLTLEGLEPATSELLKVVAELTQIIKHIHVSRVDVCIDFSTTTPINEISVGAWVTRSTKKDVYYAHNQLSGWVIGQGGDLLARIYDKTLEIKSSHKLYFKSVWKEQGWSGSESVWRVEFQYKREVLSEMEVHTLGSLKERLNQLWQYATENWLRLTEPNPHDQTVTRWPIHPLWGKLQTVDWATWAQREQMDIPIRRTSKQRNPSDDYLFKNGLAFLSSYMAREGITDINTGYARYLEDARAFHQRTDTPLSTYIHSKRNLKARSYNRPKAFDPIETKRDPWDKIPLPGDLQEGEGYGA